jgi:uncharacterized protein YjbI with pentapeptide repeats
MMASKKQLIDRWNVEPWRSVNQGLYQFAVDQAMQGWRSPDSNRLFGMLDGLPFREEVPSGRDLRGSAFPGAQRMNLRETHFTYSPGITGFRDCDLFQARLNSIHGDVYELGGLFEQTSFESARLHKALADHSRFDRCDFTGADMTSVMLRGSDLRGCVFRNADLSYADLQECDVRDCDFKGANLTEVLFGAVILDETTDLRGATLVNLHTEEHRDVSGRSVLAGTDWRRARHDETTAVAELPGKADERILELLIDAAKREPGSWAESLARTAIELREAVRRDPNLHWYEALIQTVDPKHRVEAERLIQHASMEL